MSSGEWLTDMQAAKKQAQEQDKFILLKFSGSDWCANCIRLDQKLFQSAEFLELAKDRLVLMEADFPMRSKNKLSAKLTEQNEALAERFNKKGVFPLVIVLNATGEEIGRMTHPRETAAEYVAELEEMTSTE